MKNSKALILSTIIFSILILSCGTPKDLVYKDFKNFKVEKLGFGSSRIKLDLIYYNPNNFGLQLKSTDLDIFIDGNFLGHTTQDYQIHIPKRREFTLPVQVDVDMKNIFKNTFNTLVQNEVTVKATGKVKLGKANIYKIFPVNYEGKQKLSLF